MICLKLSLLLNDDTLYFNFKLIFGSFDNASLNNLIIIEFFSFNNFCSFLDVDVVNSSIFSFNISIKDLSFSSSFLLSVSSSSSSLFKFIFLKKSGISVFSSLSFKYCLIASI